MATAILDNELVHQTQVLKGTTQGIFVANLVSFGCGSEDFL